MCTTNEYERIKTILIGKCVKDGLKFDEDIFNETLIKCNVKFSGYSVYDIEYISKYIISAFKKNLLREKQYHRNSMTVRFNTFYNEIEYEEYNHDIDYAINVILEDIENTYGEVLKEIFISHADGKTYETLSKDYGIDIKYMKNQYRNMCNYIKNKYKKLEIW